MEIDPEAPDPLYVQVQDALKARIREGRHPVGKRLPSEPDLASEFGVARGTMRAALRGLTDEGTLRRVPGRGTWVERIPE